MDKPLPPTDMWLNFLREEPQHLGPALVEKSHSGLKVPGPRTETSSGQCQVQPLPTLPQRLFRFLALGDFMLKLLIRLSQLGRAFFDPVFKFILSLPHCRLCEAAAGDVYYECSQSTKFAVRIRYSDAFQLSVDPTAVRFHEFDLAHVSGPGLQDLVAMEIEGILGILIDKTRQRLTDERPSLHSQQARNRDWLPE